MEGQAGSDSGDCSPRHRDVEAENPPAPENLQSNYLQVSCKVKIMCSYGGKILPRPLDNRLSYVGGETKILVVDRGVKFGALIPKLIALCDSHNVSFKYQLPGEDLDSLISVTNDDDLEHMMHEYEQLCRVSPKSARIRIFIFPPRKQIPITSDRSLASDEGKCEKERFVKALNTPPMAIVPPQSAASKPQTEISNADFLFESEKETAPAENASLQPELDVSLWPQDGGLDPRIKRSDDYLTGHEFFKVPEKFTPTTFQGGVLYSTDNNFSGGVFPSSMMASDWPVYLIPPPDSGYRPPMLTSSFQSGHAYLAFQRIQPEVYHPHHNHPYNLLPSQPAVAYPATGGRGAPVMTEGGGVAAYPQVAAPAGRQVIYTAPGGVIGAPVPVQVATTQAQYHQVVSSSGGVGTDLQPAVALNPEPAAKLIEN